MNATEFDQKFDEGEELLDALELDNARRPGLESTQVQMDMPAWMLASIDKEALRLGMSRQDIIKFWLADHLHRHSA
jgi:hypothetical protein